MSKVTGSYQITAVFTRELSEDLPIASARQPRVPLAAALKRQLAIELQAAYNNGDLAGHFNLIEVLLPAGVAAAVEAEHVVAAAQEKFWDEVARLIPDRKTGDVSPEREVAFDEACRQVVRAWLQDNQPK